VMNPAPIVAKRSERMNVLGFPMVSNYT